MIIFFRFKRQLPIILITCMFLSGASRTMKVYAEDGLSMYSGSYALTDAVTGRLLTGKNETNPMANASTTKILTCIVTLENSSLDEIVTISGNAASQPRVRLGMSKGEQYPLRDMLYALMLESYNDCAVAIAEHVGGSVENFAQMMNEKAMEIGCQDTYFITPNGLDAEMGEQFHHTTAMDLCRIMAYCVWESPMKDAFLEITQTRNYSGKYDGNSYSFVNRNSFLDQMDGVVSGKTGYTSKAGYCYVAAFEKDGEKFCIALLACGWPNNKTYKWKDATQLLTYGMENYEVEIIEGEQLKKQILVDGYVGERTFSNINRDMKLSIEGEYQMFEVLLAETEAIETEIIIYTDRQLPIEAGTIMGECNLYLEDVLLASVPLRAMETSREWTWLETAENILLQFLTFSSQSDL